MPDKLLIVFQEVAKVGSKTHNFFRKMFSIHSNELPNFAEQGSNFKRQLLLLRLVNHRGFGTRVVVNAALLHRIIMGSL